MIQKRNFIFFKVVSLSIDAQKTRFRALDNWFTKPQGLDLAEFFSGELTHLHELLHGETLLQLGSCGKNPWLPALHYSHKWLATLYPLHSTTLISSYNQLPIDRNSIDCVIAPLVIEAFTGSKSPLDEIDRILKPSGQVVFFGINPFSLWGLQLRFKGLSCFGPQKAKAKSVFALQRQMLHRGYVQHYLSSFYYLPPLSSKAWLDKLEILNELGKMISPCPSGFYCLVMQKRQTIHPDFDLVDPEEIWNKRRLFQPIA